MKKIKSAALSITTLALCGLCLAANAFEIGERSTKLFNDILDTSKHNLHMIVVQKIDMSEVLSPEAFQALKPHQRVRYNRFEYNETSALSAERQTTFDGAGRIVKDVNSFAKGGQWYSIDYLNKTYDRLPELPGMTHSIADMFAPYFADGMPEGGFDEMTGYDFDRRYKADKEIYFYFDKGTDVFKAYSVTGAARYNIVSIDNQIDMEKAFGLPPENFKRQANEAMRSYAAKLIGGFNDKGKKEKKSKK